MLHLVFAHNNREMIYMLNLGNNGVILLTSSSEWLVLISVGKFQNIAISLTDKEIIDLSDFYRETEPLIKFTYKKQSNGYKFSTQSPYLQSFITLATVNSFYLSTILCMLDNTEITTLESSTQTPRGTYTYAGTEPTLEGLSETGYCHYFVDCNRNTLLVGNSFYSKHKNLDESTSALVDASLGIIIDENSNNITISI